MNKNNINYYDGMRIMNSGVPEDSRTKTKIDSGYVRYYYDILYCKILYYDIIEYTIV